MDKVAGIFEVDNSTVQLMRDGQDVVVLQGGKHLGYARLWRDARRGKSGFVATAYQAPPAEGGASGRDLEVKKFKDCVAFIAREGVAL